MSGPSSDGDDGDGDEPLAKWQAMQSRLRCAPQARTPDGHDGGGDEPPLKARSHQEQSRLRRARQARTPNIRVNQGRLYEKLEKFANKLDKSDQDWLWDGRHWSKGITSHGPALVELQLGHPVLLALITEAPNGYPDHVGVRTVLQLLHRRFKVLETETQGELVASHLAAACWLAQCKELIKLKKAGFVARCLHQS